MTIDNKFEIGQTVYLVTDPEQFAHLVLYIRISGNGIIYGCAFCGNEKDFYDFELSAEKNLLMACGVENKESKN